MLSHASKRASNAHDAGLIQPGVHGQAEDLLRHNVAHGQARRWVGHRWLLIERNGVVHGGGDAGGLEALLHWVAVGHLNGVLGPDAGVVGFDVGQDAALTPALSRLRERGMMRASGATE